jgi:hypothetical protein
MSFLLRFKLFLDEFEQKNYYRLLAGAIFTTILFFGSLLYLHSNKVAFLQKELKQVNRERIKARRFLEEHARVEAQKNVVDKVLSEEKSSFKILEFGNNVIQEANLQRRLAKPLELSEPQDLGNNYDELKLEMTFTGMTMQELVDFLYSKIQINNKVYTKELSITKLPQSPTLNITLVIATLVRKT